MSVFVLGVFFCILLINHTAFATPGINQQINFQGRLLSSQGNVAADGYYNMEFKIYKGGDGQSVATTGTPVGTPQWTEDYLNSDSNRGVMVKNGFMSVQLGSVTPFGTDVDWNDDTLWLSVTIGNTNVSCTPFSACSPDTEMVPMKRLSATPYALNAGSLNGVTSSGFVQLAQGVQTDASTNTPSIYINKTGTGNLITLQSNSSDAFSVSSTGDQVFGANANHSISVATAADSAAGNSLTINGGTAGTGGAALAGGDLVLQGGAGGGTNGVGGNATIDAGAPNGTGTDGNVNIGVNHANIIQIGSTALASQTINIGNNASGTTNVTIGSSSGATAGYTTVQSKGNLSLNGGATTTIGSGGSTRATFDNTNYNLYLGAGVTGAVNPFTLSTTGGTAGVAGSALTVAGGIGGSSSVGGALNLQGGDGGSTSGAGGAVAIQGGAATAGNSNGGDLSLNAGARAGTGTSGNLYIGNSMNTTNTIQIGSTTVTAANIQTINIGTTTTGTTNVNIGSVNGAGTTTLQAENTIVYKTNAITRMTLQASNTLTLGPGTTGAATTFTVNASNGNAATVAGSAITIQGGTGNTTGLGGAIITQGGTGGATAAGGAVTVAGGTGGATSGAGGVLTIKGGNGSTAAAGGTGGALVIQGGVATGTGNFNGGDLSINAGLKSGTGTGVDGNLYIGNLNNANTIQMGNNTLAAGIQFINVGTNNTAGGTTNVTIGSGSAAAGTTTIRSRDDLSLTSSNGNVSATATAGTMAISSSGDSSITTTAGTLSTSSSGDTTITSTGGTVGLASNGVTTIGTASVTRATFDTGYNLYLGNGITGTANPFTLSATGGSAGLAGSALNVQGGIGASGFAGGALSLTGGAGTGAGVGGALSLQGGTSGSSTAGAINIGTTTASTISMGNSATVSIGIGNTAVPVGGQTISIGNTALAANIQTINLGYSNTAGGTTNVNIGSGSTANGGTTTVQSKGAMTLNSGSTVGITSATNTTLTATAGTMAISSSGDSSISATAGTFATSSSGNTTITSTGGTVGLASNGVTTIGTAGVTRATFNTDYSLYLGAGVTGAANPFTLSATGGSAGALGSALNVQGGIGANGFAGGVLTMAGGAGTGTGAGGVLSLQGGTSGSGTVGAINIGTTTASTIAMGNSATTSISIGNTAVPVGGQTINIGNTALAGNAQTINIGYSNTAGGTTNVNIGSGSTANGGTTDIRSKEAMTLNSGSTVGVSSVGNTTISTNGTTRATFDSTGNNLYLGNGISIANPGGAFTVVGTGSTGAYQGGGLTIQGGSATSNGQNGGNLTLSGGTGATGGASGLVVMNTPTFSTAGTINWDTSCFNNGTLVAASCQFTSASVNGYGSIFAGFSATGQTAALPDPTIITAGRVIYITAANNSKDFILSVNGGGTGNTIAMRQNTTATMIWNGSDWTAAGASSSTTLQSAYDNTLTTAGGAELVLSNSANANGLTIRDNPTTPINGALLEVQTSTAGELFSVNNNTTEYAKDGGAEIGGGTSDATDTTFPATTWSQTASGSAVTRTTTTLDANSQISTGMASVKVVTSSSTANAGAINRLSTTLTQNMNYNVSFAAKLLTGTNAFQDLTVYYSINGTTLTTPCTNYSSQTVQVSAWSKINCTFTVPSGATATNSIIIVQNTGVNHTFYIDNLSVSLAANVNYATDGGVDDDANFDTNWTSVAGVGVFQDSGVGYDRNTSARVNALRVAGGGIRNRLSVNPFGGNTLYRVTAYVSSSTTFNNFTIRYSPNGGTNFINCMDYNTLSIPASTSPPEFYKVTCYITTDSTTVTTPYIYFTQSSDPGANRTFYIDTFSMNLSSNTVPNVQIGGGLAGSPLTLFTVDRGASAPIAANNDALLGSMYYDTTLGKLQCYEMDGWGACGSSPDSIVTISPEYTNAVLHGTGVGTMTSDFCSDTLDINDGSGSAPVQPTICGTDETYNFYKWTSPQDSAQTYSIYVTYQLPGTFKAFASGQTSLMGRTDNGPTTGTGTVQYTIFKNATGSPLQQCGNTIQVSTGTQSSWLRGTTTGPDGAADPSACGFAAGNSIVFKIDLIANRNANAYVGNLNFVFTNK